MSHHKCPQCATAVFNVNIQADNWLVCAKCKIKTQLGTNYITSWEDENEELWARNAVQLRDYAEVNCPWPLSEEGDMHSECRKQFELWEKDDPGECVYWHSADIAEMLGDSSSAVVRLMAVPGSANADDACTKLTALLRELERIASQFRKQEAEIAIDGADVPDV